MATPLLLFLCAAPFALLFVFASRSRRQREAKTMRAYALFLDRGYVEAGNRRKGPRARGHWNGVEVSVGHFARLDPPVFFTAISAARHASPFAALLLPGGGNQEKVQESLLDAPDWVKTFYRAYDCSCAPEELFHTAIDEETAMSLVGLNDTEVEITPVNVNVQLRQSLSGEQVNLTPLLDAAVQLVGRLDAVLDELVGPTEDECDRRSVAVKTYLAAFQR